MKKYFTLLFVTILIFSNNVIGQLTGHVDLSYSQYLNTLSNQQVRTIEVQQDGKVLIGLSFMMESGTRRPCLIRLNSDGSRDSSFNERCTGVFNDVNSIAIQADGKVLVGQNYEGGSNSIARLNIDGSFDTTFNTGQGANFEPFESISAIAVQPDGKILVGGQFSYFDGIQSNCIARLNNDGSVDTSFVCQIPSVTIPAIAVQNDGKILISRAWYGGGFLSRLNPNGSYDTSFQPAISYCFPKIKIQQDNQIVVGGGFSSLIRMNLNGSIDTSFFCSISGINDFEFLTNGKIVVVGNFTTNGSQELRGVAILNSNYTLDVNVNPFEFSDNIPNHPGFGMASIQPDGKIIINGYLRLYNGGCEQLSRPITQITGSTNLCTAGSVTLTSSYSRGNLWSNGDTTQSIAVNTAGDYSVQYILGTCTSSSSATTTITVTTPIAPTISITGLTALCQGRTVRLTSSATSRNLWSNGATTRSITVSLAGNYSVRTLSSSGACTSASSNEIVVSVVDTPIITGNSSFCEGGSTILTSSSATGNFWSNGSTSQSITVNTTGNYSVQVISGTCTSALSNVVAVNQINNTKYIITTIAGSGIVGADEGQGNSASFNFPTSLKRSNDGNIYVCETNRIRKIDLNNQVSTYAGYTLPGLPGDGFISNVAFNAPSGIAIDANNNMYIADRGNNCIRKIASNGFVTVLAGSINSGYQDGIGTNARFNSPSDVALLPNGDLIVADAGNNRIRKINTSGLVSTIAGSGISGFANGIGLAASFNSPWSITVDNQSNIYVADAANNRIRKITSSGTVSTFAGTGNPGSSNGQGNSSSFDRPFGIAVSSLGNVYVNDFNNRIIRKITPQGFVTTVSGSGIYNGFSKDASFFFLTGITVDSSENLYLAEQNFHNIWKLKAPNSILTAKICQGSSYSFGSQLLTTSGTYTNTVPNANGCDSVITLKLTVGPVSASSISRSICQGSSYLFNGIARTTSGSYNDTLRNVNGCDSIVTLNLTVNPVSASSISSAICQGNAYVFGSDTIDNSGTYIHTLQNAIGCDSVVTLSLTVNPVSATSISRSICEGSSFVFGTQTLTSAGTYTNTILNAAGCDSVVTLNLTVNPVLIGSISETICAGLNFVFGGISRTVSGVYTDTVQSSNGCDSIVTLNLTVSPVLATSISRSICEGSSFVFGTRTLTSSGIYTDTVPNAAGCDSVVTLNLTVNPVSSSSISRSICQGSSYILGSRTLTTSGTYTNTVPNAAGCDSVVTLNLTVNPVSSSSISRSICQGSSFVFGTQTLTSAGTYTNTILNAAGCDSVVTLNLTVNPVLIGSISETICAGLNFVFGGISRTVSGVYTDTVQSSNGCDSIVTLNLTVSPVLIGDISQTICAGSNFVFGGISRTVSGVYTDTVQTVGGCDSVITLNLTVNPVSATSISRSICEGSSFLFNGIARTSSGSYNDTLSNVNGCDSIVTLNLTVNPVSASSFSQAICQGSTYLFNGIARTNTGSYNDTLRNVNGCDSIVTLNLTVNPVSVSSFSQAICQGSSYLFNGITRITSGSYNDTLSNVNGCDSIVTLNLTVNPILTGSISRTICEGSSFGFGTQILTTSGTYTDTVQTANRCDSLVILTLVVNPVSATRYSSSICQGNSYSFGGIPRTTSGTYTDTLINLYGCDSVISLTLTVIPAPTSSISETICAGSNFVFGGIARTMSGNYTNTVQTTGGCDSIVALNLSVSPALTGSIFQTICAGSNFVFGGIARNISGTYTDTVQTSNGCDSIVTLNLTVSPALTGSISQTICAGSNFVFGGIARNISGTYTDTVQTVAGCDSVVTLNLTVNPVLIGSISETICAGLNFVFGGISRTVSGVYTDTVQTVGGCDSVITLNLTVNPVSATSISRSICEGSSFVFGTRTLTSSGIYTDTVPNAAGCDSVITLTLTVNPSSVSSISRSICQGSSFVFGTQTLTSAGTYTNTILNAAGCDSVVTLNLTVNPVLATSISRSICEGSSFVFGTRTLTTAGIYTDTVPNAAGCDSIITLSLTVNPQPATPTISRLDSNSLCTGSFVILKVNEIGNSYLWSNGRTTRSIIVTNSGDYTVTTTNAQNCISNVSAPFAIAFDTTFCLPVITRFGDSLTTQIIAASYYWYRNGILLLSANNEKTIAFPGPGTYTVQGLFPGRGLGTLSAPLIINGIEDKIMSKVSIYPNPATSYFTIEVTNPTTIQVLNSLGQVVLAQKVSGTAEINTSMLPSGLYTVLAEGYKATSLVVTK